MSKKLIYYKSKFENTTSIVLRRLMPKVLEENFKEFKLIPQKNAIDYLMGRAVIQKRRKGFWNWFKKFQKTSIFFTDIGNREVEMSVNLEHSDLSEGGVRQLSLLLSMELDRQKKPRGEWKKLNERETVYYQIN